MVKRNIIIVSSSIAIVIVLILLASVLFYSDEDENGENGEKGENETKDLAAIAQYQLTFEATWSAASHPYDFPNNPHFSGLIGATHNDDTSFWFEGGLASPGIKNMAETGRKNPLDGEIDEAISTQTAYNKLSGGGIPVSPGSVSLMFNTSRNFPLVTVVSMIAPSPDWFVGVSGLGLLSDDGWVEDIIVDLYLYDAGTDSGSRYTSPNAAITTQISIRRIDESRLPGSNTPFGTFTFTKIDEWKSID